MFDWFTDDMVFDSVVGLAVKFKVVCGDDEVFIFLPQSKINADVNWLDLSDGETVQVSMPEWLAKEKGLI